jgi:N-acetyl-anhydromuramoyl-L-alanine amidase
MTITTEWFVDGAGWLPAATRIDSPNCDARPSGAIIRLVVMHAISLPPGEFGGGAVTALFTNQLDPAGHPYFAALAGRRVSSHFFIRRNGALLQFVSCRARAWHAGVSCWHGKESCNDYSLGIEMEGDDFSDFADAQYATLQLLLAALRESYPFEAIVGHADIAPGRKTDPGPHFDWKRLKWPAMTR